MDQAKKMMYCQLINLEEALHCLTKNREEVTACGHRILDANRFLEGDEPEWEAEYRRIYQALDDGIWEMLGLLSEVKSEYIAALGIPQVKLFETDGQLWERIEKAIREGKQ